MHIADILNTYQIKSYQKLLLYDLRVCPTPFILYNAHLFPLSLQDYLRPINLTEGQLWTVNVNFMGNSRPVESLSWIMMTEGKTSVSNVYSASLRVLIQSRDQLSCSWSEVHLYDLPKETLNFEIMEQMGQWIKVAKCISAFQ